MSLRFPTAFADYSHEPGLGFVRHISISLRTVAGGILLSGIVFTTLRNLESKNAEASFNGVAEERLDALETNVTLTVNNLVSLGALHDAVHDVQREEFGRFTIPLLARNRAIQALEWIPRVPQGSRQKYEEDARHDGFLSFQFTERPAPGKLAKAGEREEYFPVFFVAPVKGNEKALGFDLATDPVRRAAPRFMLRLILASWSRPTGSSSCRRHRTNTASSFSVRFIEEVSSRRTPRRGGRL